MRISRIFLYGLVRYRQPAFEELRLGEGLKFLSAATAPGMIFDLGDYPGFVAGAGEVKGDLFEITNPRILERLDAFEDYDPNRPGRSLYIRRPITT
ncbi:MAG: gamma-glutamylcyclotransferase family protein, partial [Alphaproteobacteria bacterium]|nr:gamma-glutamylcyclotransferase family protein [Alphaproteobacteria bacterium]